MKLEDVLAVPVALERGGVRYALFGFHPNEEG